MTKALLQGAQAKLPKRACSGLTFFDFERRNVEFFLIEIIKDGLVSKEIFATLRTIFRRKMFGSIGSCIATIRNCRRRLRGKRMAFAGFP